MGSHLHFRAVSLTTAPYDPHGHLIGSVQAMPGYDNELDLNLTEAGVYQIRCLELCGLNHSTMENTFTVTRR
jgi:heme/copper-type cytochrome/quinol oxidase subunit 2